MTIGKAIRGYESEIVKHIQELIRIRSVASADSSTGKPYGEGIHRALTYMLELGAAMGFRTANVDGYAGHVEFGSGDELVGVLVHLDTVPEGSGWTYDPCGGQIDEGCIYGRGASDNKGPAVVALYALKAIKDSGILPGRRVRIIFGTNEESGMTDMDYYFEKEPVPDYAFTPDAGYPIINAEKGYYVVRLKAPRTELGSGVCGAGSPLLYRIADMEGGVAPNVVPEHCHAVVVGASEGAQSELLLRQMVELAQDNAHIAVQLTDGGRVELTATGKSGHGSYPPSGINAISHMAEYLHKLSNHGSEPEDKFVSFIRTSIGFEAFGESLGLACNDPVHGKLTVNLAQIRMDDKVAEAILNIRYPVTVDGETVISKLKEKAADAGIEAEVTAYLAPLYIPPDHILIQKLSRAYEAVVGEKAGLLSIGGGTYARKLQNKGVAFGAGFKGTDTRAHQPDEFIVIEEIMRHGEICTQAIYELLRMEE